MKKKTKFWLGVVILGGALVLALLGFDPHIHIG